MDKQFPRIFIFLYLGVCLVPILGSADIAMTHSFYISIVNFLVFTTYVSLCGIKKFSIEIEKQLSLKQISLYALFILWSTLTIFKSINVSESLRVVAEMLNYLIALLFLIYSLRSLPNGIKYITSVFYFILILEILSILLLVYLDIKSGEFDLSIRKSSYKGLTGNINIAAFSIALKLPFLYYFTEKQKRVLINLIIYFLSSLIIIYLLKTRAAILTLIFQSTYLILYIFLKNKRKSFKNNKLIYFPVLLLISFILSFPLKSLGDNTQSAFERMSTVVSDDDTSINQRIRFYKQAIQSFSNNPILGIGIGNWELESINLDSKNITGYVIPYHAHNDFLEILAETGLIGFILYFSIIFFSLYTLFKWNRKKSILSYFLILSITTYLIDSFFNFPFARPIQQMNLLGLLSLAIVYSSDFGKSKFKNSGSHFKFSRLKLFGLFLALPIILFSTYKVYNGYTQHYYLLGQFNSNNYTQSLETVLEYEEVYPDLLPTTIPVTTMKGMFYLKKKNDFLSAKRYFKKGMKSNPHLKLSETMLGYCFLLENKIDSALYHTKSAFYKMPKNPVHFTHYILSLSAAKDTLEIINAYNTIKNTDLKEKVIDEVYYKTMSNMINKDNAGLILNNLSRDLLKGASNDLKGSLYVLEFGKEMVIKAKLYHDLGLNFFKEKNYSKALSNFEKATELNPLEIPYHENLINVNMKLGKFKEAIILCDKVIDGIDSSPKIKYMKAISYFALEENESACNVLIDILNNHKEFKFPKALIREYCKKSDL